MATPPCNHVHCQNLTKENFIAMLHHLTQLYHLVKKLIFLSFRMAVIYVVLLLLVLKENQLTSQSQLQKQ
nr:hypothetical protein Iba_scaffold21588CG0030 [Ipomoea batatas]